MKAICFREIKSFFGSLTGYLVIICFLAINGGLLWFVDGDFNVLQSGFADLSPFFNLAPWVLIFLIPAVTMKSFSEEIKNGTIELLLTKPLSIWQIVLGKFFGVFFLIVLAILPTIVYVFVLKDLVLPGQFFDLGSIVGSFVGLLFLVSSYAAIGVFSSSITENQIVAFIVGIVLCAFFSIGIDMMSGVFGEWFAKIGMFYHFRSISRGVLDTRDLLYFGSIATLFLGFTVFKIKMLRK
ncbi:gliding motility-associated ABC transporter permease subunit GldF [Myroides phaeus]|uniref:ABC-2 type transport system permease protein n=1 Tax=Myroides phaeus TaxID=702745 RepID=A0A1G8GLB8_9FLAO|nr:gliding motility-associated ABC transporter permease subunit GldF [Myroides phaeus]MEC4115871.1 gliding motility-associated ABC transporter permease subunit GldF [Myroides phaeus]SDH95152.1 ABC-2 type transport system permease protein [Myroides phaeus]